MPNEVVCVVRMGQLGRFLGRGMVPDGHSGQENFMGGSRSDFVLTDDPPTCHVP